MEHKKHQDLLYVGKESSEVCQKCGLKNKILANAIVFRLKPGGDNYANCDGTYYERGILNGKPQYVNDAKARFVGWSLDSGDWAITACQYLENVIATQKKYLNGLGHRGKGLNSNSEWKSYQVSYHDKHGIQTCDFTDPNNKFCNCCVEVLCEAAGAAIQEDDVIDGKYYAILSKNKYMHQKCQSKTNQSTIIELSHKQW